MGGGNDVWVDNFDSVTVSVILTWLSTMYYGAVGIHRLPQNYRERWRFGLNGVSVFEGDKDT